MAVRKRSKKARATYHYRFVLNGKIHSGDTGSTDKRDAETWAVT